MYVAARQGERPYVPIHEIAEELGLSFHFLTKILQQLTEADLMASYRGPKGGVALARRAETISLREIIEGIDGPGVFKDCVLGLKGCGDRKPCPMHEQWVVERERLKTLFGKARLGEVSQRAIRAGLRLAD
jgi:Rrf2 family protein